MLFQLLSNFYSELDEYGPEFRKPNSKILPQDYALANTEMIIRILLPEIREYFKATQILRVEN